MNEINAGRGVEMTRWITSQLEGRPDLVEKSVPPYPPTAKRILQDNGSWLTCLKNRVGKIYTLSPWPIETYWNWTRAIDPAEYVLT